MLFARPTGMGLQKTVGNSEALRFSSRGRLSLAAVRMRVTLAPAVGHVRVAEAGLGDLFKIRGRALKRST